MNRQHFLAGRWQALLQRFIPVQRQALPIPVSARRIYVLPTGMGLFYAGLVLAMTLGALNYGNNPALLLALLLAGIGLASALAAHLQLSGLSLVAVEASAVPAGTPLAVQLHLQADDGRARNGLLLQFDAAAAALAEGPPDALAACCALPTQRRGLLPLPPLTIATTQPLGLVRAFTRLQPPTRLLVYPASEAQGPDLPAPPVASGQRPHPLGDDSLLRDYRAGDPPSQIAWKQSARRQSLLVRQTSGGATAPLQLDWQQLAPLPGEARIARLAHWVWLAHRQQRRYALQLPGSALIGPGSGSDHLHACLRALALLPDHAH